MLFSFRVLRRLLFAGPLALASVAGAAPKVLPVLNHLIADRQLTGGSPTEVISLQGIFGTEPIDDQVVRFTAEYGPTAAPVTTVTDMALFSSRTPVTRTNFLNYVTGGDYVNSLIHRSAPGFVIQGGGYRYVTSMASVPTDPPIVNEFGISNTFGTVSMAKVGGDPNSATSQWFVSTGANSDNLDFQNGGFTVFARVTRSTFQTALNYGNPAIFPIWNAGVPFDNLPLHSGFDNTRNIEARDFIRFKTVALAPLPAGEAGESTTLTYSVLSNSNPAVASLVINSGGGLEVTPKLGGIGTSSVVIRATDSVGNTVDDTFVIRQVREEFAGWRARVFSAPDNTNDTISGLYADPDGDGITNLQLFAHGLPPGHHKNPVIHHTSTPTRPQFEFPLRNDISGLGVLIEGSSDLGVTDSWKTVDQEQVAGSTTGNIDTLTIQPTSVVPNSPFFYRLRFVMMNP